MENADSDANQILIFTINWVLFKPVIYCAASEKLLCTAQVILFVLVSKVIEYFDF